VEARAAVQPNLIFDLRDRSGFARDGQPTAILPVEVMEFLAQLTGGLFPETRPPENGWSGNTNAWDGVEYFRTLINTISALPSDAASNALIRLESNTLLVSYLPQVRHALAEQMQRRRDTEYDRPDWTHTIATLEDGAPAC
jgi:hypothetical protein